MRCWFGVLTIGIWVAVACPCVRAQISQSMPSAASKPMPSANASGTTNRSGYAVISSAAASGSIPTAAALPAKDTRPHSISVLNLNTAKLLELKRLHGVGEVEAERIINSRPYSNKLQLLTEGVLNQAAYDQVKDFVTAQLPGTPAPASVPR